MEEIKWWTWLLLVCAVVSIVLLISGPLGYKYEALPLGQAMSSTVAATVVAVCVLLAGIVMLFLIKGQGLDANRNYLIVAVGLSLVPSLMMGVQIQKAFSVPPIHDISTDTSNPPVFYKIVELRQGAANPLSYGSEAMPQEQLIKHQTLSYPQVKTLHVDLGIGASLDRVEAVMRDQGIEIVYRDDAKGIIEATDTTFWFGFKDDLVVRVQPSNGGSLIDLRSVSRVGRSDLGTNARRIEGILSAF